MENNAEANDFASEGLENLAFDRGLNIYGILNYPLGLEKIVGDIYSTTPNQLWQDVVKNNDIFEAEVIKDPEKKINNSFIEGTQQDAQSTQPDFPRQQRLPIKNNNVDKSKTNEN